MGVYKYTSQEQIEKVINDYFDNACFDYKIVDGQQTNERYQSRPYTITGLCLHLGVSKQCFYEMINRDDIGDSLKKARMRIENYTEEQLFRSNGNVTGIIFNLKNNYNWVDKKEIENNYPNGVPIVPTIELPNDQDVIQALIEKNKKRDERQNNNTNNKSS